MWGAVVAIVAQAVVPKLLEGAKNLVADAGSANNSQAAEVRCVECDDDSDFRRERVRDHRSDRSVNQLYDELDSLDRRMRTALDKLDTEKDQGDLIALQNEISSINRAYDAISNILKGMNDVRQNSIRNFN